MKNTIEQHAVLMALLGKYATIYCKQHGKEIYCNAIKRIGKERASRMAARAVLNGDKLNFVNYLAYGEWKPRPNEMESSLENTADETVLKVTKCPWNDAWRKHNLLEYGKYFCTYIDKALFSSFNYEFKCDIDSNLSWGADECYFHWHQKLTKEDKELLAIKKAELKDSCVKDFNYHTAHILYTISDELISNLGDSGKKIIEDALLEFEHIFGKEYLIAIRGIYPGKL